MTTDVGVDIGGTWLRIRIGDGEVARWPSPSRVRYPHQPVEQLIDALLTILVERVPLTAVASVSFGAVIDEALGVIFGSGPMWGGGLPEPLPLKAMLQDARPDVTWHLTNDVAAGLADAERRFASPTDKRMAYLTISSGIALRIADLQTREIPVDRDGVQGEVGHLRAASSAPPAVQGLRCLCGDNGHVAAISSGPAIPEVAAALGITWAGNDSFLCGVETGDRDATELLSTIVEPIAELLRTMRVLDPKLDLVVIGGGVAENLGAGYEKELTSQLSEIRSYADFGGTGPRLRVCRIGEIDTLAGASAITAGRLKVRKVNEDDEH